MPIRPSPSLSRLIGDLGAEDVLVRESAAARLAILGETALPHLLKLAANRLAPPVARAAAVRALPIEGADGVLALAAALVGDDSDDVAAEAIGLCAAFLPQTGPTATLAFERLTELALDAGSPVDRRLLAIAALDAMPDALMAPVYDTLARDPSARVADAVRRKRAGAPSRLTEVVDRGFDVDASTAGALVRAEGAAAGLSTLRRAIDLTRARERRDPARARPWVAVRGQLHQALGDRGSRLGLADLWETLTEAPDPLPLGFVAAAAAVGDAACLAPLAKIWVAAGGDRRHRDALARAFAAIADRERLTRRHTVMKQILEQWPAAGVLVATARKR